MGRKKKSHGVANLDDEYLLIEGEFVFCRCKTLIGYLISSAQL